MNRFQAGCVAIMAVLSIAAPAEASVVFNRCSTPMSSVAASDAEGTVTRSTTAVNVREAIVRFVERGASNCIVVDFSAYGAAQNDDILMVQALLDGAVMFPGEIQLSGSDPHYASAHAFSWTGTATPGNHIVQIQFRSFFGNTVVLHRHTTIVHHR